MDAYAADMEMLVGIDLVDVDDVEESVRLYGQRYLRRIYTDRELHDCRGRPALLAARFAAKEATIKALRPEGEAIPWRSIQSCSHPHGGSSVELGQAAAALARRRGVAELSLSVTHRRGAAMAVIVLTREAV